MTINRLSLFLLVTTVPSYVVSFGVVDPTKWMVDEPTLVVSNNGSTFTFTYGSIHDDIAALPGDSRYAFYGYECNGTEYTTAIATEDDDNDDDGKLFIIDDFSKRIRRNEIALKFTPNPKTIIVAQDTTNLYTPYDNNTSGRGGEIAFCVRLGLYSGNDEMNFLESQVRIPISSDGSVDVNRITFDTKKGGTATDDYSEQTTYEVEAVLCRDATGPFKQGDVVSVCITPTKEAANEGVIMSTVDSFIWSRDGISQVAVADNNAADLLTAIDTTNDASFIVSSVLYAAFYATSGSVGASGTATMEFSSEQRRRRRLQESGIPASTFDINANVVATTINPPSVVLGTSAGGNPSTTSCMSAIIVISLFVVTLVA